MKTRRLSQAFIMGLLLFLLAGCKAKNLPFYQFEDRETPILIVNSVRYIEDTDAIRHRTNAPGLFWNFNGEIGPAIGLCSGNAEQGGRYKVCPIKGDAEQCFLYVLPNHFVFGPYYTYFCTREGLQILPPSVETVNSAALFYKEEKKPSAQVEEPAVLAALLEALGSNSVQRPAGTDWKYASLVMGHKDFPFLQCEIKCCYSPEQETAYCQGEGYKWFLLPQEWLEVFLEHEAP